MTKRKVKIKRNGRKMLESRLKSQQRKPLTAEDKAENRRKFLEKLDKSTRNFAAAEFAKLGLYQ